jgi:hypothetical protein
VLACPHTCLRLGWSGWWLRTRLASLDPLCQSSEDVVTLSGMLLFACWCRTTAVCDAASCRQAAAGLGVSGMLWACHCSVLESPSAPCI